MRRLCGEASRAQRVLEAALSELWASGTGETLSEAVKVSESREREREEISSLEKRVRAEIAQLREAISAAKENAAAKEAEESLAVAKLRDALLESR